MQEIPLTDQFQGRLLFIFFPETWEKIRKAKKKKENIAIKVNRIWFANVS